MFELTQRDDGNMDARPLNSASQPQSTQTADRPLGRFLSAGGTVSAPEPGAGAEQNRVHGGLVVDPHQLERATQADLSDRIRCSAIIGV